MVAGRHDAEPVAFDQPGPDELAAAEDVVASTSADDAAVTTAPAETAQAVPEGSTDRQAPVEAATNSLSPDTGAEALAAEPSEIHPPSRLVAPGVIAPPEFGADGLLREAPREPLSQLGLALPPPPPPEFKNPWAGKPLFRPVAIESAMFESGGHTIAIAGVKSVPVEESCTHDGTSWPCGVRARAAVRLWLRSRALVCQIPEAERDKDVMEGSCRLAKQDVGEWLVQNGWALAAPGGPYVQAGEKARAAGLGIFGAPPDTSSLPDIPDAPVGTARQSQPIMTEEAVDPQPPADPRTIFPPAPSAP
jgi:endonuclease YncB( thermonuclease family)